MVSEKRKHPRFRHSDTVELASGSETIPGTSVDFSRSGMRVIVKMAATYDSIQSIAFQIPVPAKGYYCPAGLFVALNVSKGRPWE